MGIKTVRLTPADRLVIYHSLYPECPTVGINSRMTEIISSGGVFNVTEDYKIYGWLTIITAKYVIPIWDQYVDQELAADESFPFRLPYEILDTAERVLSEEISPLDAYHLLCDEYHGTVGNVLLGVPYTMICAAEAAYKSLAMILGIPPFRYEKDLHLTDDMIDTTNGDVATSALQAYAGTNSVPIHFSSQKQSEFWEWWLTQALPQAKQAH